MTAGLFSGNSLQRQWRLQTIAGRTADEWGATFGAFLLQAGHSPDEVSAICLASVAPGVTSAVVSGLSSLTGAAPMSVSTRSELPLTLDVDEPRAVGADRIVNALAALELAGGSAIVVDFGTATTFDCVTADRRFIGGPIMPGIKTSADELTLKAAKLPATELTAPSRVISRSTEDAIKAGVLFGAADAVDGMVRRIRAEWPGQDTPSVLATGGLAELIVPFAESLEGAHAGLTLQGVRIAAAHLGLRW